MKAFIKVNKKSAYAYLNGYILDVVERKDSRVSCIGEFEGAKKIIDFNPKEVIVIQKINYFAELARTEHNYNGKLMYYYNNKLLHCLVDIDFFNKVIYISKNQFKECKVIQSLYSLLSSYSKIYF